MLKFFVNSIFVQPWGGCTLRRRCHPAVKEKKQRWHNMCLWTLLARTGWKWQESLMFRKFHRNSKSINPPSSNFTQQPFSDCHFWGKVWKMRVRINPRLRAENRWWPLSSQALARYPFQSIQCIVLVVVVCFWICHKERGLADAGYCRHRTDDGRILSRPLCSLTCLWSCLSSHNKH